MTKWITIAPIKPKYTNRDIENIVTLDLGAIQIGKIPDWLYKKEILDKLSYSKREELKDSKLAFISEYEASSYKEIDPEWKGIKSKSKPDAALDRIQTANLALWIAKPTALSFDLLFHTEFIGNNPSTKQPGTLNPIIPHEKYARDYYSLQDLQLAKGINKSIQKLQRNNSLWMAIRTLLAALTLEKDQWDARFILLWAAIEALYGTTGIKAEISYRLALRISFFLSNKVNEIEDIFNRVKTDYTCRSEIVHGLRLSKLKKENSSNILFDTENIINESLRKILSNEKLLDIFCTNKLRDNYLDNLILIR